MNAENDFEGTVLVVDDHPTNLRILIDTLNEAGFKTLIADSGDRALRQTAHQPPDLILLDVLMPGIDGFATCRRLKENPITADIPVIFMTALTDVSDKIKGFEAGAVDYVTKPFQQEEVLARVSTHLTIHNLQKEIEAKNAQLQRKNSQLEQEIVERKRAEEETRHRNRELTLLNRVIAASVDSLETEVILETVCRELAQAFGLSQAIALLFNPEKTALMVVAKYLTGEQKTALRPRSGQTWPKTIPLPDNPLFRELRNRQEPLVINNPLNNPHLASFRDMLDQNSLAAMLILPLVIEGEVVGSLELVSTGAYDFSAEEIRLGQSVADQTSGALDRARLSETRQLLTTAIEHSVESVLITDAKGSILYVNPAFERVTGYSRAEVIGQTPRILKSGKQDTAFYQELWATISSGQTWRGQLINKKKEGDSYTEKVVITPVRDEKEAIVNYVSVQRDVTHELQLEEQYRQAQKMEAVGQLAGGVAHDFNNILTAIMGYVGLSLMTLSPDHPIYNDIQGIQKSTERAADLTRQLLTFARRQIVEPQILNLNDLILNLDKMLHRLISENIELITLAGSNLGQIKADPGQIEQVLVNLVVNARDAMPDGGKLTIETANVTLDKDYANRYAEVNRGEYVMLAVSDTGIGMTEAVQARIFEPFFTTKDVGKGTGLGLATCFGIVKQGGGHLWVYSEVGRGTTFKVYLPSVEEVVSPVFGRDQSLDLPRGTETILLVEDEAAVRSLAARILREQGYTILEATNGERALQLVEAKPELEIQLLLTDVVMPLLGGQRLAGQLNATRPHLKVLFMSGYTDNFIINYGVQYAGIAFLQKPFSPSALVHKVRKVLDGATK